MANQRREFRQNRQVEKGAGRHSIEDTSEEMERGREGKTEVKAIGQ
ncbi:MAG: hypothetical protein K2N00_09145 [Lachnospiraceae bacterium]|nr:hypothetical protein [Lachnospiraceae bacterium]